MKHYCIFEITQHKTKYIQDFKEDYNAADEMCQSMNNFRPKNKQIKYIIRCLEEKEIKNIKTYSPFISKIIIKN